MAIENFEGDEMMGRWGWRWPRIPTMNQLRHTNWRKAIISNLDNVRSGRAFHGEGELMGSWLSDIFKKGQASNFSVQTSQGGVSLSPTGLNVSMPSQGGALPGGAGGGIMEFVKQNPLMLAAGAGVVLLLVMRKKKR